MTALEHWSRRAQAATRLSKSDEWRTPPWLFGYASDRYGPFGLDAYAARWNYQCPLWLDDSRDGHSQLWARRTWANPPYSRGNKERAVRWAREQVLARGIDLACLLLPHDTADSYWWRYVEEPCGQLRRVDRETSEAGTVYRTTWSRLVVEITQLRRRLRYEHDDGSRSCRPGTARHSSALVVFARPGVLKPMRWPS